jgi:redox-sensitive bicupin YhaK (pirin superfamily)
MFPLRHTDQANTAELFQIWLNLPASHKMVKPHFTMLWSEQIQDVRHLDTQGLATDIRVVAGSLQDAKGLPPPPDSWASQPSADVAIFTVRMAAGARWTPPTAQVGTRRQWYVFQGEGLHMQGQLIDVKSAVEVRAQEEIEIINGNSPSELLMLQGRPLNEPVAQHGPFVMNTRNEIEQAFEDYRRTQFGGWPWQTPDPVHAHDKGRFALHSDGKLEER